MKLHYGFILIILGFFQGTAYAGCENANVEQLAKDFFGSHRNFYYVEPLEVKSLLTPEFYTILENEYKCKSEGELCAIEADPWLSAQDGAIAAPITLTGVAM